jgi:trans-aconitate 2-methyltransferase
MWDPKQYLKYADERARPFVDLLAQVRCRTPRRIVDLGCGTGHRTRTLAARWPKAQVVGVDDSPEMIAEAERLSLPGRLEFVQTDLARWSPDEPVDLIISNAALHWLPDHDALLGRIAAMLDQDGVLAVQMPNRFATPSQVAIEETAADPRWAASLAGVGLHRESVLPMSRYIARLHELGFDVNAWETSYYHILRGPDPVLDWLKGSGLRPLLDRLPPEWTHDFLGDLSRRLRAAYPPLGELTIFPFPRLFFVATRPAFR